jgi:probable selenate reductase FAD-binding subunit
MAEKLIVPRSAIAASRYKNDESAFLAGGTEINRLNSYVEAQTLICIGRLGLDSINDAEIDGKSWVRVGATATFTDCIENPKVPEYFKQACRFMSSMVKRNMATVGGNVATCRDDSYLIPTLVASGALLEFTNEKVVSVKEYYLRYFRYRNRLITAIYLDPSAVVKSKRYSNTAAGHGYVTVSLSADRVAVQIKGFGLVDTSKLEERKDRDEAFCLDWSSKLKNIKSDMFGSEEYKKYLAGITVSMLSKEVSR